MAMHIKLDYKKTALVGLAFMTINAVWQLYNTEVPIILTKMIQDLIEAAGNGAWIIENGVTRFDTNFPVTTVVNVIMSLDNVLAIFLLPLLGKLSDKTNTRFGKRTPFILVGVVLTALFLPFVPLFYTQNSIVGVIIMLFGVLLAMSLYRTPAVALMPDVTPKPLRSRANAIINLMGAAGNVTVAAIAAVVSIAVRDNPGVYYTVMFIATAAIILIALLVMLLTVNENKLVAMMPPDIETEEERMLREGKGKDIHSSVKLSLFFILSAVFFWYMAYGCIETNFSRFAETVLGMDAYTVPMLVATIAALICFLPLGILSGKLGRKNTIIIGLGVLLGCAVLSTFITNHAILYVLFAFIGISWAAINVNSYPMVVEMSKGGDIGKYTGIYYTFQMAAQVITPILSGVIIDISDVLFAKYIGNGLRILFPYASVFLACALVVMFFVKHGDSKDTDVQIFTEKLEEIEVAQSNGI